MKKTLLVEIICMLFILLFMYTGVNKLIDHQKFYTALDKSPLLSTVSPILSWLVPLGEIAISIALFNSRTRKIGLICASITMAIFTIYVGYMLTFRSDRPCTCGGVISLMNWHQHLYFNAGFTLLGTIGFWIQKRILQQGSQSSTPISYAS